MAIATSTALAAAAIAVAVAGSATSISLGAASASQQKKLAKRQLQAQADQAKVASEQKIRQVRRLASSQRSSFLASGISLTGDGTPDDIISETFDFGMEDVENIRKNGIVGGDNISANARAKMLSTYGNMASSVGSYASSALSGAGGLSTPGSEMIDLGGGLEGMGDGYGGLGGMGSGAGFGSPQAGNVPFNNFQAPKSFGGGYGT